jgi:hypothetical protein
MAELKPPTLRASRATFRICAAVILAVLALPAIAQAAECPNEQSRRESVENPHIPSREPYSTQLPDCRAYELVSPNDNEGPVESGPLDGFYPLAEKNTAWSGILPLGNLLGQLAGPLDVQGAATFWHSIATPPGTGAIADGRGQDTFRAARAATGWSTADVLPYNFPYENGGFVRKLLDGVSSDGSAALIATNGALVSDAFLHPEVYHPLFEGEYFLYRVTTAHPSPQLITRGEPQYKIPDIISDNLVVEMPSSLFYALSASADLREVAFASDFKLEKEDVCPEHALYGGSPIALHSTVYSWNAGEGPEPQAHTIVSLSHCVAPNVDGVPTILPDGRPVIEPNAANPLGVETGAGPGGKGYDYGPLVLSDRNVESDAAALTPLAGPNEGHVNADGSRGGQWLGISPDGLTAYVQSAEPLDVEHQTTAGANIYAVSTTTGVHTAAGKTTGGACVSCTTDQTAVTYVGMSHDGSHLFFTTAGGEAGLWSWNAAGGKATRMTDDTELSQIVPSETGQFVVAITSRKLSAADTNGGPDIYEFSSTAEEPKLITSGTGADTYSPAGVSNDGARVVYDDLPGAGGPQVIDESSYGRPAQISPLGAAEGYGVQALDGGQLENIFFLANTALVPADANTLNTTVYDARVNGGFPPCTPGNPLPPPGTASCLPGATPTPTSPPNVPYEANLTPPSGMLGPLPEGRSLTPPKTPTRAQKLAKALKACHKLKNRRKRISCEKQAHKNYGKWAKKRK